MPTPLYLQLRRVMKSERVRSKLAEVADRMEARAQHLALEDTADDAEDVQIGREDGTRPAGRPYSRVTASLDQEFGTSKVARRRILGRSIP
jgi:hypothetical protein